jgi:hypothetical protein
MRTHLSNSRERLRQAQEALGAGIKRADEKEAAPLAFRKLVVR